MFSIVFVTLYPFLYELAISFSGTKEVLLGNVSIFPKDFTLTSYKHILTQSNFWLGYKNTILYTVLGTFIALVLTIMCAYPLSKSDLFGSTFIMKFIVFTMFFSGGLIPFYMLIKGLDMIDTVWAMVVPGAINAYNVLIMRTFFKGIPKSLEDAAEIDGLGKVGVLIRIVLPLSMPIIATITLFVAVWLWNEWFLALIVFNDDAKYPVTLFLRNIVMGSLMSSSSGQEVSQTGSQSIPQTLQAATIMLITIPILLIYPFLQKYFVKGVMIGSVKG